MQKKQYLAPQMELIECKVEQGFAGSQNAPQMEGLHETNYEYGDAIFS